MTSPPHSPTPPSASRPHHHPDPPNALTLAPFILSTPPSADLRRLVGQGGRARHPRAAAAHRPQGRLLWPRAGLERRQLRRDTAEVTHR
eukprot:1298084-Prymnesium_polylepis.1